MLASNNTWARLYFVSFYVIAVVMVLNLVVAFMVDAFFERKDELVAIEDDPEDAVENVSLLRKVKMTLPNHQRRISIATRVSVEDVMN